MFVRVFVQPFRYCAYICILVTLNAWILRPYRLSMASNNILLYLSYIFRNGVLFRIHTLIVFVLHLMNLKEDKVESIKWAFSRNWKKKKNNNKQKMHFILSSFWDVVIKCNAQPLLLLLYFLFFPQLNAKVNAHVEFNHFTLKTLYVCLCLCIDFMNLPNVCEHRCVCIFAILYVYVFVASIVRRRHFLKLPSTKRYCIDSTHFRQLFHLILTRIFD